MPVSVKVHLNGTDRHMRKLKEIDDFSTPLRRSGTYMERSIMLRFRSAPWKPLSSTTIKIRPWRAGGKPLNDTGRLKMSVTSGAIRTITKKQMRYGTNLVYAPMHNFGGVGGWGKRIPQREFLYFDEADQRAIKRIFEDYVKELTE